MEWVRVAELKDLTRRRKTSVTVGDEQIALFLVGDEVFALADVCIHKQRSLSNGTVFRDKVICPGHQWQFDLATGWVEDEEQCQPTYAVKVEDGGIHVIPEKRVLAEAPIGMDG